MFRTSLHPTPLPSLSLLAPRLDVASIANDTSGRAIATATIANDATATEYLPFRI